MEDLQSLIDRSKETVKTYFARTPLSVSPTNEEEVSRVFTPTLRKVSALIPGDRDNNCMLELRLLPSSPLSQTPYRHVRIRKSFEKRYETRRKSGGASASPRAIRAVSALFSRPPVSPRKQPPSPRVKRSRCLQGLITICDSATSKPFPAHKQLLRRMTPSPRINH
jgi:hypothetical protein